MKSVAFLRFLSRCSKLHFYSLETLRRKYGEFRGDHPPFGAGFPIGARSIPVGTRFCFAKSSVLYLCFRLTRERGWRHTLRCGRVWQQTLFRGSRTGGFCDAGYVTNAGFLRSKIRLAGKGSRGIYKLSSRRSDVPRFSVSSVFPCHGSWSFSRAG